ncbi:MAG: hypothetical protein ACYTHJ_23110 [Planctomycetota bacterium]|jgi:predicted RNA-binding Zn-ribbon protein involved in translation (DUF1610 family)
MSLPITPFELDRIVENKTASGARIPPFCVHCDHNLSGTASMRCPECGTTFVAREWRARAAEVIQTARETQDANTWAGRGLWLGGLSLLGAAWHALFPGFCAAEVGGLVGMFGGTASLFLGLGVFRFGSVPEWAREFASEPDHGRAVACVFAGIVGIVTALL